MLCMLHRRALKPLWLLMQPWGIYTWMGTVLLRETNLPKSQTITISHKLCLLALPPTSLSVSLSVSLSFSLSLFVSVSQYVCVCVCALHICEDAKRSPSVGIPQKSSYLILRTWVCRLVVQRAHPNTEIKNTTFHTHYLTRVLGIEPGLISVYDKHLLN